MQVNTRLLNRCGTLLLLLGLVLAFLSSFFEVPEVSLLAISAFIAGITAMVMAYCMLPGDFYPQITREVFKDYKTFEDFKLVFDNAPSDLQRIVWYVYNLPPNDFVNFVRLVCECREAANDETMRRLSNYMRTVK